MDLRRRSERQERCAPGDAWRRTKHILKLEETDKATSFSPTNECCLPAPTAIKPEERESVVDTGASMHMLSRKDLNSAELETVKVSKSLTTVVTANVEVQTKEEETTVCVQRIGLVRDSRTSGRYTGRSPTRKTLRRSRIFLRVDHWSEVATHQRWQTDKMQHGEPRADRCPWFIDWLFQLSYTYISNISIAGSSNSPSASRTNKK